ncbi:MAG: phosphate ABC transporter permease PstA [SAR202 cluster bacterium]|nr:phosphate ABC transporter permease PstA [SAR202 cluster bacterium]
MATLTGRRGSFAATRGEIRKRRIIDRLMVGSMIAVTALVCSVLFIIIAYIFYRGVSYINWEFLTSNPRPVGSEGGGIVNAIVGSLILVGIASVMAVPVGVGAAIFIGEFPSPRLQRAVRFMADVLTGVPSIVVGLFAYALIVEPTGTFSGWAGSAALGFIIVPIVLITAQEALRLVPGSLREAALALGVPRWRVIMLVVVPAARRALLTGLILATARALGETAPLIFTTLGNNFWNTDPSRPLSALPLVIYRYAVGPYQEEHRQAWAAAFMLLAVVFFISLMTRVVFRSRYEE